MVRGEDQKDYSRSVASFLSLHLEEYDFSRRNAVTKRIPLRQWLLQVVECCELLIDWEDSMEMSGLPLSGAPLLHVTVPHRRARHPIAGQTQEVVVGLRGGGRQEQASPPILYPTYPQMVPVR
ncbi:unnamed protein product [Taenia asiatica]|uniref:Uncharacterized protein n=1 Tax=Taenia asiatica TaxID=60517 RepID=A0A3P6Q7H6_TAEAS|nr:unnamed protein product [Taenia asiatica]